MRKRVVALLVALAALLSGVLPASHMSAQAIPETVPAGTVPLYRFYNYWTMAHFFTASAEEKDAVIAKWDYFSGRGPWNYEGIAGEVTPVTGETAPAGQIVVYRFYNYWTGAHFFTADPVEKDGVIAKWDYFSGRGPWNYEGVAYAAYPVTGSGTCSGTGTVPFYRFYNYWTMAHFFTTSAEEKDSVIAKWDYFSGRGPWNYEGFTYCITPASETTPPTTPPGTDEGVPPLRVGAHVGNCEVWLERPGKTLVHFNLTVTSPDGRSGTYWDEVEYMGAGGSIWYQAFDTTTTPTCTLSDVYYVE